MVNLDVSSEMALVRLHGCSDMSTADMVVGQEQLLSTTPGVGIELHWFPIRLEVGIN